MKYAKIMLWLWTMLSLLACFQLFELQPWKLSLLRIIWTANINRYQFRNYVVAGNFCFTMEILQSWTIHNLTSYFLVAGSLVWLFFPYQLDTFSQWTLWKFLFKPLGSFLFIRMLFTILFSLLLLLSYALPIKTDIPANVLSFGIKCQSKQAADATN